MPVDVLAISAHPDDVELTCGGTLVKLKQRGYRFGIVDLTRGEMGTRGTPEIREREARRAAEILGADFRDRLVSVAVEIVVSAHADRKRANENGEHDESSRFPKHMHHRR